MMHEPPPPLLDGCTARCCGFGFAFVQSRWLLMYLPRRVFKVDMVRYVIFAFLWCLLLFLGWLCFSHSNPNPFAPGGIMFDLWLLVATAYVFGNAISAVVCLPPLFGYMLVGMALRNLPVDPTTGISKGFSEIVKEVALTIIVSRAGLGLPVNTFLGQMSEIRRREDDEWRQIGICQRAADTLGRLKNGLLLAVTPMTLEAATYAPIAMALFGFDVYFGFLLGFVMAAVSPAVVVPGLIDLQARGFVGGAAGTAPVPSIVMFASGLDDIFAITLFGIFFGMSFGGGAVVDKLIKAPCEIVGGVLLGFLLGTVLFIVSERLVPKQRAAHGADDPEACQASYKADIDRFGVAHAESPFMEKRLAQSYKSNLLVFGLVFLSSVAFVIGFAHVEVGEAGELTSLGVLGAMAALFALNYHYSQAEFKLSGVDNDIHMLEWCVAQQPALEQDAATRKFFSVRPEQSLRQRTLELEKESAALNEKARRHQDALTQLNINMKSIWDYAACPLLFSLVGRSIVVADLLDPDVLPKALVCLVLALLARCIGAFAACTGSGWPWMNRFFVAFAWLPKATVQAAVGGLALAKSEELWASHCEPLNLTAGDACEVDGMNITNYLGWSKIILQLSVLGILVTAPLGAAAIAVLGPRWLGQQECADEPAQQMQDIAVEQSPRRSPFDVTPLSAAPSPRRRSSGVPDVLGDVPGRMNPFVPVMAPQFREDLVAPHLCDHPAVMHLTDLRQPRYRVHNGMTYMPPGDVDPAERELAARAFGIHVDDNTSPEECYRVKRSSSFPCSYALRNPSSSLAALPSVAARVNSGLSASMNSPASPDTEAQGTPPGLSFDKPKEYSSSFDNPEMSIAESTRSVHTPLDTDV